MTSEIVIGIVETSLGSVLAMRGDGTKVELHDGDEVFQGDWIETGDTGIVGISFIDGSGLALGAGGEAVIERYVFDRATRTGECFLNLVAGSFGVSPGSIGLTNADAMTIATPVAAISASGARVIGQAGPEGSDNSFSLIKDDSAFGQIVVHNGRETRLLDRDGQTVAIGFHADGVPEPVVLPRDALTVKYAAVNSALPEGRMEQAAALIFPDGHDALPGDLRDVLCDASTVSVDQVMAFLKLLASDGRMPAGVPDETIGVRTAVTEAA